MGAATKLCLAITSIMPMLIDANHSGQAQSIAEGGTMKLAEVRAVSASGPVTGIAWSSDGSKLAAIANFGQRIEVWRTDGTHVVTLRRNGPYLGHSIAFLADGSGILAAADAKAGGATSLNIWEIASGAIERSIAGPKPDATFQYNSAAEFVYSPAGGIAAAIAMANNQPVTLYSAHDWTIVGNIPVEQLNGATPTSLDISARGDLLAVGTIRGFVKLFQIGQSAVPLQSIRAFDPPMLIGVGAVALSPDRQFVATGAGLIVGGGSPPPPDPAHPDEAHTPIKVWRVADGERAAAFVTRDVIAPIGQLTWSPDGRYLAAGSDDGTVRIFAQDGTPGQVAAYSFGRRATSSAAFSPDGQLLAAAAENQLKLFELHTGGDR